MSKALPGSSEDADDIFDFPFLADESTVSFLERHSRVMFIVRGPPGTAKNSLARLLQQRYPRNSLCSADAYFHDTFTKARDKESLKKSHEHCHKMVERACLKNSPCIIVKNTHMRKFEMQRYLDLAAEHIYTVIMAVTLDKFSANPEVLTQSNNKGLTEDYFRSRLKQWEDVVPVHTGWFLAPDDTSFVLGELATALDALLGDGKFCHIMNAYTKDDLLRFYRVRKMLYCIAACGERNNCSDLRSYHSLGNVKKHYGECFDLSIVGYIISPSWAVAVCHLDPTMKSLQYIRKPDRRNDEDSMIERFAHMAVNTNFNRYCSTTEFIEKTLVETSEYVEQWKEMQEPISFKFCSFMPLAKRNHCHTPTVAALFELLGSARNEKGNIDPSAFMELEDNFKVCRLNSEAWLVRPPCKVSLKTVFTGLYT